MGRPSWSRIAEKCASAATAGGSWISSRRPDVDLARRRPAGDEAQVEARRLDRPGDEGGAAQMADAQQMLDVEQDHGSHSFILQRQVELPERGRAVLGQGVDMQGEIRQGAAGGSPSMGQPVARA